MTGNAARQQYITWAREVVASWDGISTAELFRAILERTGEDAREVVEEVLREEKES